MTITGSIGSISGKFNVRGMWSKVGVTFDSVEKGPNALFNSEVHNYTEEQWQRFVDNHWDGVNAWMRDIADHRGMTFEELVPLAYGRVWTGRQAMENGLIDETGGLVRAIEIAKAEAGIEADTPVDIDHVPHEKGLLEMITSGESATSVASWMLYRFIHHDLAETFALVTGGRLALWTGPTGE
jgi:protease-4